MDNPTNPIAMIREILTILARFSDKSNGNACQKKIK
jgi:hypothetical protein